MMNKSYGGGGGGGGEVGWGWGSWRERDICVLHCEEWLYLVET